MYESFAMVGKPLGDLTLDKQYTESATLDPLTVKLGDYKYDATNKYAYVGINGNEYYPGV